MPFGAGMVQLRRVPHARVVTVRRDVEGQTLGILRSGPTGEILEVLEDGLARLDHHLCLEMSPQNNASQPK